ncbi:methyltransferase [archaeon]|nr:methyltransferase [archaeon]NCQ50411.1 methyltransferase [archaeon]
MINDKQTNKVPYVGNLSEKELFEYYDNLNKDTSHYVSNDDICTSMNCVKTMIDYIPKELWEREVIKVLDPCSGNGNFGAYCKVKTNIDNIYFNELNPQRYLNCKALLNPKNISNLDMFSIVENYDLIMANPPYSGGANKNTSISNKFIEKSIDLLLSKGYLCFIAPNNWMTYNNNNVTLKRLLNEGSFIVIDNDAKKFFPGVGSSFTIFVWQKGVLNHKTTVKNNFLIKDTQEVLIPKDLKFIPLYLSNDIISIVKKVIKDENNSFNYRCDLHNFTQKNKLSDNFSVEFPYETIHTARKTRYANIKQDIYDKWNIIIPLSTYFVPYVKNKVNTTQSVGYISFEDKISAEDYIKTITKPEYKIIVHLTRYGNFNNIMVLKHLNFDKSIKLSKSEKLTLNTMSKLIKY